MLWNVDVRGFLPSYDPINTLPLNNFENTQLIYTWENFSINLPNFIKDRCIREELFSQFKDVTQEYEHGLVDNLGGQSEIERAFLLLSFFTMAYLNAHQENKKFKLPAMVSTPFARAAFLVGRQPILDYYSYCMFNWCKKKKNGDITIDNLEPINTFTDTNDEKLFITSLIELENRCTNVFKNKHDLNFILENLKSSVSWLSDTWSHLNWEVVRTFSRYFTGADNVLYSGWLQEPKTYCYILTNTPILNLFYKILGVGGFSKPQLQQIMNELSLYMPREHHAFIQGVPSVRDTVFADKNLVKTYNECLNELRKLVKLLFSSKLYPDLELDKLLLEDIGEYKISD